MSTVQGDYHAYLEGVYPGSKWAVNPISGGHINKTIRVTKFSGKADADSLILKHARPMFGEGDRVRRFSLARQDIERAILQLWDIHQPLHDLSEEYQWRLPICIRHDKGCESDLGITTSDSAASVLLIEDLGQIEDVLTCLEAWSKQYYSPNLPSQITAAGITLGTSLALLHSQSTVDGIGQFPEIRDTLSQSLAQELVWAVMVDPMPKYLKDLPDGDESARRVAEDFKTPKPALSAVLSHGDFHNGNIMFQNCLPNLHDKLDPIVLDWEFAHLNGRGINGDAAEFTAGLHCKLIHARNNDPALARLLRGLLTGFCQGYRETARRRYRADKNDVNLQLLRSAMLFHGTEMVSCAFEYSSESKAFGEIFEVGVWYLRRAGKDMCEFVREKNLVLLREEDEGIVTSLFLEPGR